MAIIHKGKYKRIGRIEADFQGVGFVNIILEVYNSAEDREKTKNGIEYLVKSIEGISLDNKAFNTDKTKDMRDVMYVKIKETEEYKDAEDAK